MTLFVDTSAWYAAADEDDVQNDRARAVLSSGEPLLTTQHVLVETWLLIRRRLGRPQADAFWAGLRRGVAVLEQVTTADLENAWMIGDAFSDQDFSLVDRTSFAVMERLRIHRTASFDDDFAIYRHGSRRDKAFTVVR